MISARSSPAIMRDDRLLDVAGEAGGDAVAVVFEGVPPLGLEEDLVLLAVGEADDLVLDRGAVARAGALDLARVHRGPVQVGADDVVDGGVGRGDVAVELRLRRSGRSGTRRGPGSSSPGWGSRRSKSMVRPLSRGGVPVLNRRSSKPSARRLPESPRPRRRRRGRPRS